MAVAARNAFTAALGRIGINPATRVAIAENGFVTILDLATVQDEDLDKLPKHLEAWRNPNAGPNAQVCIPFVSLTKLKAMRYWVLAQRCIGIMAPDAADFSDAVLEEVLTRMKADKDYKKATEDTDITKPAKLTDLVKCIKFWELFTTYLGRVKGAALIPLTYLIRDHEVVTQDMLDADYPTVQERLIATTALSGAHFELDNRTLYDEFKPLIVDGPGWSFVKRFDRAKDGRSAVLALKAQAEGTSAKLTRKQTAYASIASSAYLGPRKGFTFANYVTLHQAAHNELFDLDEPVSESKKVTDFLKGIRDPTLNTGKSIVLGDPVKLGSFEECQQYLSTVVQNMAAQSKSERHVSSVSTDGGSKGSSLVDKIKGGSYTDEQFRSLSDQDKKRVQKFREEAKRKKKEKRKVRKEKRKLAKAKSDRDEASGDEDDATEPTASSATTSSAGSQFGSNGTKAKKAKH
ncbi:hypothetical protein MHU86_12439 [Fragilaria crotonensis]|nr:hypothetical protein MHU86_12439 [Fragilaria crotonensis]